MSKMIRAEFVEQYRSLSELERNAALLDLYLETPAPLDELFPDDKDWFESEGQKKIIEEKDKRRKSPQLHLLGDKAESLLTLSYTTDPCQAYIHKDYLGDYELGVDKRTITIGSLRKILFKEHNINPGIFGQESGKVMEKALYRHHAFGKLDIQRIIEQMDKERGKEPNPPQEIPPYVEAILNTNPNLRTIDPDTYAQVIMGAEARARKYRLLLKRWPLEFYKMHQEEI